MIYLDIRIDKINVHFIRCGTQLFSRKTVYFFLREKFLNSSSVLIVYLKAFTLFENDQYLLEIHIDLFKERM